MATPLKSTDQFVTLLKDLKENPQDNAVKMRVVEHYAELIEWGKKQPINLYHLAKAYMPNSGRYEQLMTLAASYGCTNAKLALCELWINSKNPEKQAKVATYLSEIEQSGDSYIIEGARELVQKNAHAPQHTMKHDVHGFFAIKNTIASNNDQEPELSAIIPST